MHEYSLMENVTEEISRRLADQGICWAGAVKSFRLRVGSLELHSEESFKQAFAMQAKGTVLDGAELELEIVPGFIKCEKCGEVRDLDIGEADGHDPYPIVECPKCGTVCYVQGGRGVDALDFVVEDA